MTVIESAPGGELTNVPKTYAIPLSNGSTQDYWAKLLNLYTALGIPRPGQMLNGKISPSVSSGDLVLSLKTASGANPSADDPVYINISGTVRKVTAATSCTLAAATNWMNLGAAEFATLEQDLFTYAVWDSADSVVAIAPSRIPYGRLVSDFNSTNTNERFIGNYANYTSTDECCVVGRFAATLSAGAGYTWSVPVYTNSNLIQEPIYETRGLSYVPQWTSTGTAPALGNGTIEGLYKIRRRECTARILQIMGSTTTYGTGTYTWTAPFTVVSFASFGSQGVFRCIDISAANLNNVGAVTIVQGANSLIGHVHGVAGNVSGTAPITLATSDQIRMVLEYPLATP